MFPSVHRQLAAIRIPLQSGGQPDAATERTVLSTANVPTEIALSPGLTPIARAHHDLDASASAVRPLENARQPLATATKSTIPPATSTSAL